MILGAIYKKCQSPKKLIEICTLHQDVGKEDALKWVLKLLVNEKLKTEDVVSRINKALISLSKRTILFASEVSRDKLKADEKALFNRIDTLKSLLKKYEANPDLCKKYRKELEELQKEG